LEKFATDYIQYFSISNSCIIANSTRYSRNYTSRDSSRYKLYTDISGNLLYCSVRSTISESDTDFVFLNPTANRINIDLIILLSNNTIVKL